MLVQKRDGTTQERRLTKFLIVLSSYVQEKNLKKKLI